MRGLSPDQTLVLINGKRRHASALVNVNGSIGRGSAAVDMNSIPTAAIGNVQVLRDGASAQYGSDAIAGVLNVILREAREGGGLNVQWGQHFTHIDAVDRDAHDGDTIAVNGWVGLPLGAEGFVTLSGEYRDRDATTRAGLAPRQQYAEVSPGVPDPREDTFDRLNHRYGNGNARDYSFFINSALPVSEALELYAFGGYQDRHADSAGFFRRSLDSRNLTDIYPDGFLPIIVGDVEDYSFAFGGRGAVAEWDYDLSFTYGSNTLDYSVENSLNVSLGPTSPTEFDAGSLQYNQYLVNADIVRTFTDTILPGDVTLAFGGEYRHENYQIEAGQPESYITGAFPGAGGSQVFPGFQPNNEVDANRHSFGVYGDIEWAPTDRLLLSGAVRYEDYSDFGDTVTGKVPARYEFSDSIAIRGAFSTGFRAPSLQQQFFTATSTNFSDGIPAEVGTFPPSNDASIALGAQPLDAEDSTSYSAGVVLTPFEGFFLTIDGYIIKIDEAIFLSENLSGADVDAVLSAAGVTGVDSVRFFQNGIDLNFKGLDIVTRYNFNETAIGRFGVSLGVNLTDTDVTYVPENTVIPSLALFGRDRTLSYEQGAPNSKIVANIDWSYDALTANLRATRFGEVIDPSDNPLNDFAIEPEVIVDLSVNYQVTEFLGLGLGVDNLFDVYPTETPANQSFNGIFPYSSRSPFGFSGRFAYARASLSF